MTAADTEGLVRRFLAEQVLGEGEVGRIGRDDHLLKMGVLNSLTLTHLIVFLEEQLGIRVGVSTVSALFLLLYLANGALWLRSQGRRDAEPGTIRPAESSAS